MATLPAFQSYTHTASRCFTQEALERGSSLSLLSLLHTHLLANTQPSPLTLPHSHSHSPPCISFSVLNHSSAELSILKPHTFSSLTVQAHTQLSGSPPSRAPQTQPLEQSQEGEHCFGFLEHSEARVTAGGSL